MDNYLRTEELLCLRMLGVAPSEVLKANPALFKQVMSRHERAEESLIKAASLLRRQKSLGIYTLPFYHPDFPESLKRIGDDCPPLIHLLGNKDLLCQEGVAIIGARQATGKGREAAYKWGVDYGRRGKVVISGLALGCDTAAHQGCLAGKGYTIAIVASGLDITHPRENIPLQELILNSGGLLLSEQVIGVKANPTRLVARNRLQAALSQEIVVAQCPARSGTMHTVRFARKYGKKIYAVQYERYDEMSSGNEYLIKEGMASPL